MAELLGMATCDICGVRFDAYRDGMVISRCCGSTHCPKCAKDADARGDYSADADCVGDPPEYIDASHWRRCKGCAPCCPNCGDPADFESRSESFTETHGLDCGPYEQWTEEWLTCSRCGSRTDDDELRAANPDYFSEEIQGVSS
jgi:hypothetical protein